MKCNVKFHDIMGNKYQIAAEVNKKGAKLLKRYGAAPKREDVLDKDVKELEKAYDACVGEVWKYLYDKCIDDDQFFKSLFVETFKASNDGKDDYRLEEMKKYADLMLGDVIEKSKQLLRMFPMTYRFSCDIDDIQVA